MRSLVLALFVLGCDRQRAGGLDGAVVIVDAPPPPDGPPCGNASSCSVLLQAGCVADQRCTLVVVVDATMTAPAISCVSCEPDGNLALGAPCTIPPVAQGGVDSCVRGTICAAGHCEQFCDNQGGTPGCPAGQHCIAENDLAPFGTCEP